MLRFWMCSRGCLLGWGICSVLELRKVGLACLVFNLRDGGHWELT